MSDRNNYSCMARNEATDYGHGYEIAEDGTYVRVKGKSRNLLRMNKKFAWNLITISLTIIKKITLIPGKLAALWPFLCICAEVIVLCTIILVYEKRRNKEGLEESDTDQSPEQ